MATSHAPASATTSASDRSSNHVLAAILCIAVVVVAMGSLWIGLSGLMNPELGGGTLRALGGVAGFLVIFALTLVAAVRQK